MVKHRQWLREMRCRSQDWLRWACTLHLPTHRQAQSSLTWDVQFFLINSNLLKGKSRAVSWSRMAVSTSVIHLCDHVADGGLWLPCLASQERLSYQIWLAQENIKIKNSKYNFYLIWIIFTSFYSWKINLNLFNLGTICILLHIWKRILRSKVFKICVYSPG